MAENEMYLHTYLIIFDVYGDIEVRRISGELLDEFQRYEAWDMSKELFCANYAVSLRLDYLNGIEDIFAVYTQQQKPNFNIKKVSKIR